METTLHQQLKAWYCPDASLYEQQLGSYRIDVLESDRVIEIQCSSLAAIRDKVRTLSASHDVTLVKPIIRRRMIQRRRYSQVLGRRLSPKVGEWLDVFEEFVHFVTVFPQPRLTLDLVMVDVEEIRRPPRRRCRKGYRVEDRMLLEVIETRSLRCGADLYSLLPAPLPPQFTTAEIAETLQQPRWVAQKIAYCLRECDAANAIGKIGNAIQYERTDEIADRPGCDVAA